MDKYDAAIAHLTAHPDQIHKAWLFGTITPRAEVNGANVLFKYCKDYNRNPFDVVEQACGCLTMVRHRWREDGRPALIPWVAENRKGECDVGLSQAIGADTRLPMKPENIKVSDLPVFAEWQRRLDRYYAGGEWRDPIKVKLVQEEPKPAGIPIPYGFLPGEKNTENPQENRGLDITETCAMVPAQGSSHEH